MKPTYIISFVLIVGILPFSILINLSSSPETQILGEWNELTWEYERVNLTGADSLDRKAITEDVKELIGQDLVIHQAEKWVFLPNGRLKLISENEEKTIRWRLKGRGHILQLKYSNDTVENYSLTELDKKRMVLNFESDVHARGIAKLTFEKNN
ncbi:MAG: hypothetical protein ACK4K0_10085 [Flavobacteriales bacterium]